jgi:membrane protein implicated in regulation of membrane protease activity
MRRRRAHTPASEKKVDFMAMRIPNLAVLLLSLGIGALAIYQENVAIAAICLSIAALYAALIWWQWKRRRKKG